MAPSESARAAAAKIPVHFAVAGLLARDELVLKSMFRLLQSRAPQPWVYRPAQPDVILMGRDNPGQDLAMGFDLNSAVVVYVGTKPANQIRTLSMPLNPHEVEALVKELGEEFIQRSIASTDPNAAGLSLVEDSVVSLARWPSLAVLNNDKTRSRIAALLMGKQMRLGRLHELAAVSWAEVRAFAEAAQHAGFLRVVTEAGAVAPASSAGVSQRQGPSAGPASRGLLSAIRERLGIRLFGRSA